MEQTQLARRLPGPLQDQLVIRSRSSSRRLVFVAGDERLLERLEMRVHVVDPGLGAKDVLDALGDLVRLRERDIAGPS